MSAPAAIQGTFSNFRMIRGRKICELVIEVPIEYADKALAALGGVPNPAVERWVAVARLDHKAETEKSGFQTCPRCWTEAECNSVESCYRGEYDETDAAGAATPGASQEAGATAPHAPASEPHWYSRAGAKFCSQCHIQEGLLCPRPETCLHARASEPKRKRTLAERVALTCQERSFQRFMAERDAPHWFEGVKLANTQEDVGVQAAAHMVRDICGVLSRSEITEGTHAGRWWGDLYEAYLEWQREQSVRTA